MVFPLPEGAQRGREMLFTAALPTELLSRLVAAVRGVGLKVDRVDIAELALRNLTERLFPEVDQAGGAGLHRAGGGPHQRHPRRLAVSLPPGHRAADGVTQETWDEQRDRVLLQVQRSIDYFESAMNQNPCQALLVVAPHAWLDPMVAYLGEALQVPVQPLARHLSDAVAIGPSDSRLADLESGAVEALDALGATLPAMGGTLRFAEASSV